MRRQLPPPPYQDILDAWNATAKEFGLRKAVALSMKRRDRLRALWQDEFWRENWRKALERIGNSAFCRGEVNGWTADIEFFLRHETVVRAMEGKYDNKGCIRNGKAQTREEAMHPATRRLMQEMQGQQQELEL